MNVKTWVRCFVYSAGAILLFAGVERLLVATGKGPLLNLPEPVMGIPLQYAVLMVGVAELLGAFICLFGKRTRVQLIWLAWLVGNYGGYRVVLLWQEVHPQLTCIGALTDPLQLDALTGGIAMGLAVPGYLLGGSAVTLLWLRLQWKSASREAHIRMFCPGCGGHIKFHSGNLGHRLPCPHCLTTIILRKPEETLKISCFFCKGHIEFPAHALGQKLKCPHCEMDISLKPAVIPDAPQPESTTNLSVTR